MTFKYIIHGLDRDMKPTSEVIEVDHEFSEDTIISFDLTPVDDGQE